MGNKEVEYSEALTSVRHMVDYRAKIFNFAIILNATLLVVVLRHMKGFDAKISVSILSILITLIFFLINNRVSIILDRYLQCAKKLEKELKYSTLNIVLDGIDNSSFRVHNYFQLLYMGVTILWIVQCIFIGFYGDSLI